MVYKIIWSPIFFFELENIYNYLYFKLIEPSIAKRIYYQILDKILLLDLNPERNSKVQILSNFNLRKFIIKNYIIIYEIDNNINKVFILHIFHNNQNYLEQI